MQIEQDVSKERFNNINAIEYQEELYLYAKNFNFSKLNTDLLKSEVEKDPEFQERILDLVCMNLGYSFQELLDNFTFNRIDTGLESVEKLIKTQELRLKKLLIEFMYELLPFNYLIKIARIRGKYDILTDIREDIITILNEEILKCINIDDTLDIIYDTLSAKVQKDKYMNLSKKISVRSDKVVAENRFLIGIIDELELDSINSFVNTIIKDTMVWDNLE